MGTKKQEYTEEFKRQAIELAEEIGATAAAEKLGVKSGTVIGAWKRWATRRQKIQGSDSGRIEKPTYKDLEAEVAQLRKQLREERKVTEILKDATAFFSQHRLK